MRNQTNSGEPTPSVFDDISIYWTEMADANETGEQLDFVKESIPVDGIVLDLDCGSGRHTVPLTKDGYNIVGLDISKRLLRVAVTRAAEIGISLRVVRADMRFLPFQSDIFKGVFSLGSSFGYLPSEDEDEKCMRDVFRILMPSGSFLIDVFNGEQLKSRHKRKLQFSNLFFGLARYSPFYKLFPCYEFPSFYLIQKRSIIENGAKLRDDWIFRQKKTGRTSVARHVLRLFKSSQLGSLLLKCGFEVTKMYGNYDRSSYSDDSRRLIDVASKNG